MSTRGRPEGSFNKKRGRKSLTQQMYTALKSNDSEKISEIRNKVQSSSKETKEKVQKAEKFMELTKKMKQAADQETNGGGGAN